MSILSPAPTHQQLAQMGRQSALHVYSGLALNRNSERLTFTFYFLILNNPNNKNHLKQKAEKLGKNRKVMVIPQIIKIKRISAWTHNSKQFTVFLDGRKMPRRIGNGEGRKIAVDPGFHELSLKMGLLSNTVQAAGSLGQMPTGGS